MDLILIPGLWLDGSSWDDVAAPLRTAGHTVHAVTLPGLESRDADRSAIGLRDHVGAVLALVDRLDGPVVVAGHSAAGAVAHAVVDARPERVARVIYVDSVPVGDGEPPAAGLPTRDGEVPVPDWSDFDDEDLVDLDEPARDRFRAMSMPSPAGAAHDRQELRGDDRRYDVPATVIACEYSSEQLRSWMASGSGYVAELARLRDVELVDLPTGHWPQLTRPSDLADVILRAVERS